jgi:hypothetical protein
MGTETMANDIFITQGALSAEQMRLYIPREADMQVLNKLQQHQYVLITEPHQQGITSLLNITRRKLALSNSRIVYLDMAAQRLDNSSEGTWYPGLAEMIREQLDDVSLASIRAPRSGLEWGEYLAKMAKAAAYANRHVIVQCDNLGSRPIPNHATFFGQMRVLFSQRPNLFDYNFVTFMVTGSFTESDLLPYQRTSPFNIVDRIPLADFDFNQVRQLVGMAIWNAEQADRLAERILHWTGGQPSLTQWFCSRLSGYADEPAVDEIARQALASEPYLLAMRASLSGRDDLIRHAVEIQKSEKEKGKRKKFIPELIKKQLQLMLLGVIKDDKTYCAIRSRLVDSIIDELSMGSTPPERAAGDGSQTVSLIEPVAPMLQKPPANWLERIQVEFTPKSRVFPTTSSQYVRAEQFAFATLTLNGENLEQPDAILRIKTVIQGRSLNAVQPVCLHSGEKIALPLELVLIPEEARKIDTIQSASLDIRVEKTSANDQQLEWVYERSFPIHLQAHDVALLGVEKPDGTILDLTNNLAAWVTFTEPTIDRWLSKALDHHPLQQLVGYQGGGDDEQRAHIVREQVKAIYKMLKVDVGLRYVNSNFSLGRSEGEISQRVRLPIHSLATASANCIDGAVLFASLLMAASIEPLILLKNGHAIAGWKTWKHSEHYEFVETIMISQAEFEAAHDRGQKIYNDLLLAGAFKIDPFEPGFAKIIDVHECQQLQHIHPFASIE